MDRLVSADPLTDRARDEAPETGPGRVSNAALGRRFGVNAETVARARRGESWR